MSFQDAIKVCFQKYADFSGTAKRPEFWWWVVFCIIISAILNMVLPIIGAVFSLAVFLPSLSVGSRRLHDVGMSGWWQLIGLTGIGVLVLIYFWAQKGKG
ncbi:DUF805 domain-containing protein [Leptospira bandrabouensis]|uniref:DUF805 domain-containing protein n=1 Tax=Leptospira bandrabouensis TaxID=2484903 RepID=UPI001EE8B31A|nr:DUF805 domain-containing protein [Leptospira bandrabouensis]MCG6143544.1 DUF805 domain-containing protein [Leptospira bandrabouensis]MCG6159204.1 DUF805 domain-containing protein [Leptospira bandrabouensis]MCG6163138.1 DUF805 domain-containing protein [Leptospira bandrabouensis]MCW7458770.1 DUF805 domain-containing protein [Leptospira bandrabouensis]MCW7476671.1 DUF805 domain-containing protein [Leptospira bandrabouensis]